MSLLCQLWTLNEAIQALKEQRTRQNNSVSPVPEDSEEAQNWELDDEELEENGSPSGTTSCTFTNSDTKCLVITVIFVIDWNGDVNRKVQDEQMRSASEEVSDEENFYNTPVNEHRSYDHLQSPSLLQQSLHNHPNPLLAIHLERQRERLKEQEQRQQVIHRQNQRPQRPSQEHLYQNVRDSQRTHFGPY